MRLGGFLMLNSIRIASQWVRMSAKSICSYSINKPRRISRHGGWKLRIQGFLCTLLIHRTRLMLLLSDPENGLETSGAELFLGHAKRLHSKNDSCCGGVVNDQVNDGWHRILLFYAPFRIFANVLPYRRASHFGRKARRNTGRCIRVEALEAFRVERNRTSFLRGLWHENLLLQCLERDYTMKKAPCGAFPTSSLP